MHFPAWSPHLQHGGIFDGDLQYPSGADQSAANACSVRQSLIACAPLKVDPGLQRRALRVLPQVLPGGLDEILDPNSIEVSFDGAGFLKELSCNGLFEVPFCMLEVGQSRTS